MSDLHDDEPPLDPASERLRRRLMRLLAISVATMLLGVMAVLAAVVYKVRSDVAAVPGTTVTIALAPGTAIRAMALDGDEALLTLGDASGQDAADAMVRVDLRTGAILARYRFALP